MVINHPSVTNVGQEDVFEGGQWKRQVVVETDLILDGSDHRYDAAEVGKLQEKVVDFMKSYPSLVDTVVVRQQRR